VFHYTFIGRNKTYKQWLHSEVIFLLLQCILLHLEVHTHSKLSEAQRNEITEDKECLNLMLNIAVIFLTEYFNDNISDCFLVA
jgi:SPX domain protein involved in polyphosphate accumulation